MKHITLESGSEGEGWLWAIKCYIYPSSHLDANIIQIRNFKEDYEKNKNGMIQSVRKWQEKNSEKNKEDHKQWLKDNPDKKKQYNKKRREKEEHQEYMKQYLKEYSPIWRANNPDKIREYDARIKNKRKRNLGFIPLNTHFEDAEAHHVDKDHVIYIPKTLHNNIYHNLSTGQGMAEINAKAFQYLFGNN